MEAALSAEAQDAIDTSGMSAPVAKAALDGWTKKKVGDLWDHVSLNDNTQCATVVWDKDWDAPQWVTTIWDKM